MESIFVLIPAYRDPEILRTVQDLYVTAAHPERVFLGICWQFAPLQGEAPLHFTDFEEHIRVANFEAAQSQGMGWARFQAAQLYQDEDYVLCVDAHTQFLKRWDELLTAQLAECASDKALLSGVPHAYQVSRGALEEAPVRFRYPSHFGRNGVLRLASAPFETPPSQPVPVPFLNTRFMFARGSLLTELPPDPYSYFTEEEISLSLRAWSRGWDILSPPRTCVWHLYQGNKGLRPLHWHDHERWRDYQQRSTACLRALMAGDQGPFNGRRAVYGLGTERETAGFERWAGVDFRTRRVEANPADESFAAQLETWHPAARALWTEAARRRTGQPTTKAVSSMPGGGDWRLVPNLGQSLQQQPIGPLALGDLLPCFSLPDQDGKLCHIEIYAGRLVLLHVVTDPGSKLVRELARMLDGHGRDEAAPEPARIGVFPGSAEQFSSSPCTDLAIRWCFDTDGRLVDLLQAGRGDGSDNGLVTYVLNPNLRIVDIVRSASAADHLAAASPEADDAKEPLHYHPPVMVIPRVLDPALVRRLISYWESGEQFVGGVGAGQDSRPKPQVKRRTDVSVKDPELLHAVDQAFAKNLFPELRKLTGYDLRYRERYKIGCYFSEDRGAFNKHRDTGEIPLSFRRYAVSLFLNEDFDGGGLVFPEYGESRYIANPGAAVVFPATIMHEVRPVTHGRRMVLITFLFDEEQAAFRSCHRQYSGEPDDTPAYRTTVENHVRGLPTRLALTRSVRGASIDRAEFRQRLGEAPPEQLDLPRQREAPTGVLVVENHLPETVCRRWCAYAEERAGAELQVVDFDRSDASRTVSMQSEGRVTERVPLDAIRREVADEFGRIFGSVLAHHYHVDFEWFEAPQMLRYQPGGIYRRHADADHWVPGEQRWVRTHDRDYSVLLYLNDEFEGGELHFPRLGFQLRPRAGMLVAFPSNYRYEHAAEQTTRGRRYALVSWGAVLGSQRVKDKPPFASYILANEGW